MNNLKLFPLKPIKSSSKTSKILENSFQGNYLNTLFAKGPSMRAPKIRHFWRLYTNSNICFVFCYFRDPKDYTDIPKRARRSVVDVVITYPTNSVVDMNDIKSKLEREVQPPMTPSTGKYFEKKRISSSKSKIFQTIIIYIKTLT